MTENQEQKWEDMTSESLEAQLRGLPELKVPESLMAKLLAQIPKSKAAKMRAHQVQWQLPILGGAVAVAAVLILTLIFTLNYGPSVPSQTAIADLNDRANRYVMADKNN
ncbi:MAG: hypothetical protein ACYS8Y_09995, partial [Planctomycetota bacterium]